MRYYESLYIINPNYEQNRLDEVIKVVADKVGEYGFSVINHRLWGKKRLAYSIQKHKYGTFVLLQFETESSENLARFERFMVLQKPILRNQTVVLAIRPEVHTEEDLAADQVIEEKSQIDEPRDELPKNVEFVEPEEQEKSTEVDASEQESTKASKTEVDDKKSSEIEDSKIEVEEEPK